MEEGYYIFSAINSGWLTASAVYSSDVTQAMKIDRDRAFEICGRHFRKDGSVVNYIPVPASTISELING